MKNTPSLTPSSRRQARLAFMAVVCCLFGPWSVWAQEASSQPGPVAESSVVLDTFTVQAEKDVGYGTRFSTGASRINMENMDVSASIITLNEKFLDDLKPVELYDALKYVSGVAGNGNTLNSSQVTLRGYQTNMEFREGIREVIGAVDGGGQYDPFSTARMEIIKGPAGVLFGATTVGGIFNRVSKRPLPKKAVLLRATVGGDEFKRLEVDAGGPLTADGKFRYRAGLVWQDAETFLGGTYDREGVFGALQWRPTDRADLSFRYEYQHNVASITWSSWFMNRLGQVSSFLDRDIVPHDPWDQNDTAKHFFEVGSTVRISPNISTRLVARFDFSDEATDAAIKTAVNFYDGNGVFLGREIPVGATPAVSFDHPERFGSIRMTRQRRHSWGGLSGGSVNYDITANGSIGPATHRAFLYSGLESGDRDFNQYLWDYSAFDFLHPVYEANPEPHSTNGRLTTAEARTARAFNAGVQDNVGFWDDRIVAAVGARYDWAEHTTVNNLTGATARTTGHDWTYKYGLVGKIRSGVGLYAQHSETFQPLGGTDHLGQPFKNLEGQNDEVGLKLELLDGGFTSTVSVFDMRLKNQVLPGDTLPDGRRELIQIGENKTKGWEVDFAWQASPAISFLGGYGDLSSVNERDLRIRHVPQGPNYKLFGKYSFLNGPLKGFDIGLGYVYVNERAGDDGDAFTLPDYSTWDLMANFRWKRVQFSLMVRNLTDETYINTGGSERRSQVGEFRTIRFSTTLNY